MRKMWFAENKSWSQFRRSLGGFSAIVCKDASTVWAEDPYGKTIAQGEAGVDDASVIQSALDNVGDYASILLKGNFLLNTHIQIPSKKTVVVDGILKQRDNVAGNDINIIRNSDFVNGDEDITLIFRSGYVDGNNANQPAGYSDRYAVFFKRVTNLKIYNLEIRNPYHWACRIDYCDGVFIENFASFSDRSYNDGLHLVDTINVEIKGVRGVVGDDLFAITADYRDVYNITATNIVGSSTTANGIRIYQSSRSIENEEERTLKNIEITNFIIDSPYSHGVIFNPTGAKTTIENITLRGKIISPQTQHGVILGANAGELFIRLNIDVDIIHPAKHGIVAESNTTIKDSTIKVSVEQPGDGFNCVRLPLTNSILEAITKYDTSGYSSPQHSVVMLKGEGNIIIADIDGGLRGIMLGTSNTAVTRTRIVANIKNCDSWAIAEEGMSDYNEIEALLYNNGSPILISGSNTKIYAATRYQNSGTATFSGNGTTTDFEIGAHGLVITDPSKIAVKVTPVSSDAIAASPCVGYVDPADNTKIRVKFSSAPASGSENVKIVWCAEVIS